MKRWHGDLNRVQCLQTKSSVASGTARGGLTEKLDTPVGQEEIAQKVRRCSIGIDDAGEKPMGAYPAGIIFTRNRNRPFPRKNDVKKKVPLLNSKKAL